MKARQVFGGAVQGFIMVEAYMGGFRAPLGIFPLKLPFYEVVFGIAFLSAVIAGVRRLKITLIITVVASTVLTTQGMLRCWSPGEVLENTVVGGENRAYVYGDDDHLPSTGEHCNDRPD